MLHYIICPLALEELYVKANCCNRVFSSALEKCKVQSTLCLKRRAPPNLQGLKDNRKTKKSLTSNILFPHNSSSSPSARASGLDGGRTFFNAVKEGDTVIFASDDEQDRILWVQAMYRATGQSHKPVPPTQVQKLNSKGGTAPQLDAPISQFCKSVTSRCATRCSPNMTRRSANVAPWRPFLCFS